MKRLFIFILIAVFAAPLFAQAPRAAINTPQTELAKFYERLDSIETGKKKLKFKYSAHDLLPNDVIKKSTVTFEFNRGGEKVQTKGVLASAMLAKEDKLEGGIFALRSALPSNIDVIETTVQFSSGVKIRLSKLSMRVYDSGDFIFIVVDPDFLDFFTQGSLYSFPFVMITRSGFKEDKYLQTYAKSKYCFAGSCVNDVRNAKSSVIHRAGGAFVGLQTSVFETAPLGEPLFMVRGGEVFVVGFNSFNKLTAEKNIFGSIKNSSPILTAIDVTNNFVFTIFNINGINFFG